MAVKQQQSTDLRLYVFGYESDSQVDGSKAAAKHK
jgi:hypothetical protein